MTQGGEINFTDKFFDIIESIWAKDKSEITYKVLELEKNPDIDNNLDITDIDVAGVPFDWNVKIGGKWSSMKIGRIIRSIFGPDMFPNEHVSDFIKKYNNAAGKTTPTSSAGTTTPKKTTTYTGGTTSKTTTTPSYSEFDDYYGYGGEWSGTTKNTGDDLMSKYGYSRGNYSSGYSSYYREPKKLGTRVEVPAFKYDPTNVRNTFLSLTTKTYPHFSGNPHEKEVLQFLPKLEEDRHGNYYKVIGKSNTMFTSHLDTADREQKKTKIHTYKEGNDDIFQTDGSILGADDKAGVTVMLYMMAHNVPGMYYFFIGEERGGIGSRAVANNWTDATHLHHIKKCVSFDRKRYGSVITSQGGRVCCSNEFGTDLCKELNKSGKLNMSLDPTGVWTDSAAFIELIPECTNISVGYFNEHTHDEIQNISFLERLAQSCVQVDWEKLVLRRNIGFNSEILRKYQPFIEEFRKSGIACSNKLIGDSDAVYLRIELDEPLVEIHNDLLKISVMMNKHKIDPDIVFQDEYIKIELK